MKKITLLLMLLTTLFGYSQVNNYSFAQSTGTYTTLSGGTVLGDVISDDQYFVDPLVPAGNNTASGTSGVGIPIGFDFTFNGQVYNRFGVRADGWISLGISTMTPSVNMKITSSDQFKPLASYEPLTNEVLTAKIAALTADLQAQTGASIRYQTLGDSPNKVLVVQWDNYKKKGAYGDGDSFDFQIRLYETSNVVQIVYGDIVSNAVLNSLFQVGLRVAPSAVATNFLNRTSSTGWDNTVAGAAATDRVLLSNVLKPAKGLTYSWTPPTCGGAKDLVASAVTTTGATLSWGSYIPAPTAYEYVVSASSVKPTGSGTATVNASATVTDLSGSTLYNVFVRSKCNTEFTPWILLGTFRTVCLDTDILYENFDSYNSSDTTIFPDCWARTGTTGTCKLDAATTAAFSAPTRLKMEGYASATAPTVAYAVLPSMSNLQAGTHRLRFKGSSSVDGGTIEIGYFADISNAGSFVSVQTVYLPSEANMKGPIVVTPGKLPSGVKNLVIKDKGFGTGYNTAYFDDFIWEPIPNCADVTAIVTKGYTHTSVNLSWAKGASETQWQYICAPTTSVINPYLVTPVDVTSNAITINDLSPLTTYKIWVRSKCSDTELGAWIGPIFCTTTCAPVNQFTEYFEGSGFASTCWTKVGTGGTATISTSATPTPPTAPAILTLSNTTTASVVVSLPPVSNYAGNNRLKFRMRGSVVGAKMDIGYLTDVTDASTFSSLQTVTSNSTTVYENFTASFGADLKSPYIAFRVQASSTTSVYIDNVVWEPIPTCADVTALATTAVTSNTASLSWTSTANQWQYAIGAPTVKDPSLLTPVNVSNSQITINGLSPVTSYRMWVRSKCGDSFGSWADPIAFTTSCVSGTTLLQNFDTMVGMPDCWTKVGINASTVITTSATGAAVSLPNGLNLKGAAGAPAVCAMPPLSNAGAGTHRLRFKSRGATLSAVLEVGYMMNFSDITSFKPLFTIPTTQVATFEDKLLELGLDPATDIIAFRNATTADIYIDDVVWEPIPTCADVKNVIITEVGAIMKAAWTAGGSEKQWQYVVGSASVADPNSLTPITVTSPTATVDGLTGVTNYKLWVRSACNGTGVGAWIGPVLFTTACGGVTEFNENFDAAAALPSCWTKAGTAGNVSVGFLSDAPSKANALTLAPTPSNQTKPTLALPPVSNITAKDHVLKLKYRAQNGSPVLEVGFLKNVSDPASFVLYKSLVAPSTAGTYYTAVISMVDPASSVMAFRLGSASSNSIFIDDVSWEVVTPTTFVANDTPSGATALTVGTSFASNSIIGTNMSSTGSFEEPAPGCGNYNGDDVWYSAVVPASGNMMFEVDGFTPGLNDTAGAVYSGSVGSLALVICDDSSSKVGGDHPQISLTGRTPGEVVYFRVWENGGDFLGPYKVSVYDTTNVVTPVLGIDTFETNNFTYYPNPVKDLLNLSLNQEISEVVVSNLLGQQLIKKAVNSNQTKIDMSAFSKGTYLVKVTAGNQSKAIKVVKE